MTRKKMEKRILQVPNHILITEIKRSINNGQSATFRVKGFSMRPFLENERDVVKVEQIDPQLIKKGDVVLAEIQPQTYVLHRVADRTDNQLTLRGDGNAYGVEHCTDTDVVGIITAFYRKGRKNADLVSGLKWKIYSLLWPSNCLVRRVLLGFYRRQPFRL